MPVTVAKFRRNAGNRCYVSTENQRFRGFFPLIRCYREKKISKIFDPGCILSALNQKNNQQWPGCFVAVRFLKMSQKLLYSVKEN